MSPIRTSLLHAADLMRQARAAAHEQGLAIAFPFMAGDVEALHTHSARYGRGVYFRLKDGRVFSAFGIELDPNPACYDTIPEAVPTALTHIPISPARRT
jgi:hypothetical protein